MIQIQIAKILKGKTAKSVSNKDKQTVSMRSNKMFLDSDQDDRSRIEFSATLSLNCFKTRTDFQWFTFPDLNSLRQFTFVNISNTNSIVQNSHKSNVIHKFSV